MVLKLIRELNKAEVFLLLILLTLPLKHNFNSISIILFVIYTVCSFFKSDKWKTYTFLDVCLCLLFIYIVLSFFWSADKSEALKGITRAIPFVILPLVYNRKKIIKRDSLLKLYVFGIFIYQTFCLVTSFFSFVKENSVNVFFYHNLSENLFKMNAIFLSVFVAFSYFILMFRKEFFNRKIRIGLMFFNLAFLLLLSSKNIIISVLIISTIFLIKQRIKKKHLLFFLILLIPFSIKIKERFTVEMEGGNLSEVLTKNSFGNVYKWNGTSLRLFQYRVFLELAKEANIFVGLGINSSQNEIDKVYKKYNLYKGFYGYNLHNQYTQIILELGLIGLGLLLFVLFICLSSAIENKDKLHFAILFVLTLLFLTESYLWRQRGVVFFVIINLFFYKEKVLSEN